MRVGDLVKYASHHDKLQHLVGVVVEIKESRNPDGYINFPCIRASWSPERPQGSPVWDWKDELIVISGVKDEDR
jgi:hypothetical protein